MLGVYFVANINGSPLGKDGNGFISRLTRDGKVDSLKFIAGGRGGAVLNAPKGMAISGDTLWVADIDAARAFHKRSRNGRCRRRDVSPSSVPTERST